ncbi:Hpt domain-containing protein [Pseudarthrobacter sp. IC2-21]|uniref:Hpt domain-containing protein n=1 Tax=Pseudarthrobacter sp. IC2-21 TaxID=3092262 RepID=UPI002A6B6315|nr:Hpt domain-containing protein [Pseudarthrobacter sp. IC2-21]
MDSAPLTSSSGGVPAEPLAAGSVVDVKGGVHPSGPTAGGGVVRWVELEILAELEAELDGPELARGFARDYAAMWDQRFSRVAAAVLAHDRKAALDAVISLRIASTMVGGVRLAMLAQQLEDAVRLDDYVKGQDLLAGVAESGVNTVSELQANYILRD